MVEVEDTCPKGHKSRRRCFKDPAGLPCHPCKREADAVQREVDRDAEARAAREREREAATARLAEARRAAAQERERLAHETELLRLERDTQRAEVDAERTRASQRGARSSLEGARATAAAAAAAAAAATEAPSRTARAASTAVAATANKSNNPNTSPAATGPPSSPRKTTTKTGKGKRKRKDQNIGRTALQGSTLLLVAQAAAKGDARGITDALQEVPAGKQQEHVSHALAVAIGEPAYDWFSPGTGGESSPVGPPTPRAAQALGMMASGEWVKARQILTAIVQDADASDNPKQGAKDSLTPPVGEKVNRVDPFAVFALALCDHHLSGSKNSAAADQQLAGLAAARLEIWPGPPDSRPPPSARAFPLGALVRAHLLAASSSSSAAPSSPQQGGEDGETSTATAPAEDLRARACSLAVSFLRAPAHARKVGKVDSSAWTAAAEALIRDNGDALARELWGPEGGSGGDEGGGDGGPVSGGNAGGGDELHAQWQKLQAKWGISSEGMDSLLEMSGLDAIKTEFLTVSKLTIVNKERGYDPSSGSFNIRLEGNPGTGESRHRKTESVSKYDELNMKNL